jgi:hypothetical protein
MSSNRTSFGLVAIAVAAFILALGAPQFAASQGHQPQDGSVLPFPDAVSGSKAARTMQESTYSPRPAPQRLRKDAPNVVVILLDDAGPALASTFGGDIRTPTLDRLARDGVSFNQFHTTAMCSPTRGALLTGRNHTRARTRADRKPRQRLGWLQRRDADQRGLDREGAGQLRLRDGGLRQVAQHAPHRNFAGRPL